MNYTTRIIEKMVIPQGEPIFSERATSIRIEDDAAGEYLSVTQINGDTEKGNIIIEPVEWLVLREAIDIMFEEIQQHSAK